MFEVLRWLTILVTLCLPPLSGWAAEWEFSDGGRLKGSFVRIDAAQVVVKRGNRVSMLPLSAMVSRSRSVAIALALKDRPREWSNGEKKVRARYAGFKDGKVQLRIGGKKASAFYSKLTEEDKTFVRSQLAAVNQLAKLPASERKGTLIQPDSVGLDVLDWYVTRYPQTRIWTSKTGKRISGRMVGTDGDHVCISSGATRTYVLAGQLSFEDQDFVRNQLAEVRQKAVEAREAKARALAEKKRALDRRRIEIEQAVARRERESQERASRYTQQQSQYEERTSIYPNPSVHPQGDSRDAVQPFIQDPVAARHLERSKQINVPIPEKKKVGPPPSQKASPLQLIATLLFYAGAIGSFICAVILSLKMLSEGNPIVGAMFLIATIVTLSVFSLALYIIGWMNAAKRNLETLMSAWTLCLLLMGVGLLLAWGAR